MFLAEEGMQVLVHWLEFDWFKLVSFFFFSCFFICCFFIFNILNSYIGNVVPYLTVAVFYV